MVVRKVQWLEHGLSALPRATAQRVRLFRLALGTAASFRALLDRALAASGLTTQQAALLQAVESATEPPRLGDVAAAMDMSHQNVKQLALALERKGFLTITPDPQDGRVRRLTVTARHKRFWRARGDSDFARVAGWSASLDDASVDALVALLAKLAGALSAIRVGEGAGAGDEADEGTGDEADEGAGDAGAGPGAGKPRGTRRR